MNSPPSFTITGVRGSTLSWRLCRASSDCVEGRGGGQLTTGPLPQGAAAGADGDYVLRATQTHNGETSSPASVSFDLDRAAPPAPTNVRVTSGDGSARPAFAWTPGEPRGSFAWELEPTGDGSSRPAASGKAEGPAVTIGEDLAAGEYRFRVRQIDEAGNAGPTSAPINVVVGAGPAGRPNAPEITSPPPAPGNVTPTFTWRTGADPGVDSFSWEIVRGRTTVAGPTTTKDTQAVVSTPLEPGSYTFRVSEITPSGSMSVAARQDFVITDAAPPPSVTGLVLTPGIGQVGLVWTLAATPDVAAIRIMRRSDTSPEGPLDAAATQIEVPADARMHVDAGLAGETTYHYAIYARSAAGAFSAVAATGSAAAQSAPPAPVTPPAVINEPPSPPPPAQPAATAQSVTRKPAVKPKPRAKPTAKGTLTLNPKRLRPLAGVSVRFLQPQLRWADRSRGAQLYNLQIFDAKGRKLHTGFPRGRKYIVPPNVLRAGHRYFWRVWPWYGPVRKFSAKPLGVSYFRVKGPIIPQ